MIVEIKDKILAERVKRGEASLKEVAMHFLENNSALAIATAYADVYTTKEAYNNIEAIEISAQEFFKHFKIKGYKISGDGKYERDMRGRKMGSKNKLLNEEDGVTVISSEAVNDFIDTVKADAKAEELGLPPLAGIGRSEKYEKALTASQQKTLDNLKYYEAKKKMDSFIDFMNGVNENK